MTRYLCRIPCWMALVLLMNAGMVLHGKAAENINPTPGDPVVGEQVARALCVNCHIVDNHSYVVRTDAVPSFPWIAHRGMPDEAALKAFLSTLPHDRMQDWSLTRAEIRDLSAYIMTLKEPHH